MQDKFALISVSDKTDVERIARSLTEHDYEILSTGGTASYLRERGVVVTDISDITGFPEIMDGRVKSLHPLVHAGILGRRDREADRKTMSEHGIPRIDVVVANLYPFSHVVARTETTHEQALENIDIGGPTLVRGAAKNYPWVTVVVEPADYARVIEELNLGGVTAETRRALACKAFAHTARYDAAIHDYLRKGGPDGTPDRIDITLDKVTSLRYGENPHQHAALYREDEDLPLGGFVQLHGKDLSYNNIVDLDAACELVGEFDSPAAAVIKHTNPAGCATGDDAEHAFTRALSCDPTSAFGGIIAINRPLSKGLAEQIAQTFFEIVAAPSFEADALGVLTKKKSLRLLTIPSTMADDKWRCRQTALGWLVQEGDAPRHVKEDEVTIATKRAPTEQEWADLLFAWAVSKHVKSNAIVLASQRGTIGIGAGQMSRVDAVELAIKKAQHPTEGAVLASDAFFPFRDGPDIAAKAGITAIIQPGGSVRDQEVVDACNENNIAMVFTGFRHFRH